MSSFDQLLERIFTCLGWNEPTEEWIPPSQSKPSPPEQPVRSVAVRRNLYRCAIPSTWGVEASPEDPKPAWRSFLHGLPAMQPMGGASEPPPPNRRKRPALAGLTAFPTPRGLLVAQRRS